MINCITVSTKYDNILDIILPQNYKFFKTWYIITSENDEKTIDVINKYNFDNVKILFFDFYKNATLNKGGAVKYAQSLIDDGEDILLLDSDIYLTDEFMNFMNYPIEKDTLYSFTRYDYYSYSDFINNIPSVTGCSNFMGFFQLYKNDISNPNYFYEDSFCCRDCDYKFCFAFESEKRILLDSLAADIVVKHLGRDGMNHYGRESLDDFVIV